MEEVRRLEEAGSAEDTEVKNKVVKYMVKFNSESELNKALNLKKTLDSVMNHIWLGLVKLVFLSVLTLCLADILGMSKSIIRASVLIMLIVMFIDIAFCTIYFIDHQKTIKIWKSYIEKLRLLNIENEFIIDKEKNELTIIEKDIKHDLDRININKISNIRELIYDKETHSLAIAAKPIETKVIKGVDIVSRYIISGKPYNIIENYVLDDNILSDLKDIILGDTSIIYKKLTDIKNDSKSEIRKKCLLDDGKCAFNLKGRCNFCNFEDRCEDKDKNKDGTCEYWRCTGRSDCTWCNIYKV